MLDPQEETLLAVDAGDEARGVGVAHSAEVIPQGHRGTRSTGVRARWPHVAALLASTALLGLGTTRMMRLAPGPLTTSGVSVESLIEAKQSPCTPAAGHPCTPPATAPVPPVAAAPPVAAPVAQQSKKDCVSYGQDCRKSKCCSGPGEQCFEKAGNGTVSYWAECRAKCTPGPDPTDKANGEPWTCKTLGARTPGSPKACSKQWQDCRTTKCCVDGGMQCFAKSANYATCKATCAPNAPDMSDRDPGPWACTPLGPRTPGRAAWVQQKCSKGGEDCSKTRCCAFPGMQCFEKDGNGKQTFWASCKAQCHPGEKTNPWDKPWTCKELGSRTPHSAEDRSVGTVQPWVASKCAGQYQDCSESKCCLGVGMQCYEKKGDAKKSYWAQCKETCSTAPDKSDKNATWTCKPLGTRSIGLALKGWPSLFCFSVMQIHNYEFGLMKAQMAKSAGIFACDGYAVLSSDLPVTGTSLGKPPDGGPTHNATFEVKTLHFEKVAVGRSQDGTAGNAKLFMKAWDLIVADGRFRNYDWTVKLDPDAVLVADRLRMHLSAYKNLKVYVVNCNKVPGSPNFPMMFGAIEVFSREAMAQYAASSWKCGKELPWKTWGEDYFMTHCMDYIGVGRISDFQALGDKRCVGANCLDKWTAAFHDFKSIASWMTCWDQTTR